MDVTIRKKNGSWYVFVNHKGQRKATCVGESRAAAVQVQRLLEAKLALGDIGIFGGDESRMPNLGDYADLWIREYARMECKSSTADGYESVLDQYLRPKFAQKRMNEIRRSDTKKLISEMISKELSRSTVRNALSVLRGIFTKLLRTVSSNQIRQLAAATSSLVQTSRPWTVSTRNRPRTLLRDSNHPQPPRNQTRCLKPEYHRNVLN